MIDRRIRAVFRKHKLQGLAVISVLGLASVFAVNMAGFLVLLPRPLWGLIDAAFVVSYFSRFSIFLALAFLASRYSGYFLSALLGVVFGPFVLIPLVLKRAGRRLIRISGHKGSLYMAQDLLNRHDNQDKDGYQKFDYESLARKMYNMRSIRDLAGLFYIMGRVRGGIDYQVQYYIFPLQFSVSILTFSALFMTFTDGILLITLGIMLVIMLPPTLGDLLFNQPNFRKGISFFTLMKVESWKMINLQKVTLLALTISFASGVLHHRSLLSETELLYFVGDVNAERKLILSVSSGFVVYSVTSGYQFISTEGTQINVLPLTSEISPR